MSLKTPKVLFCMNFKGLRLLWNLSICLYGWLVTKLIRKAKSQGKSFAIFVYSKTLKFMFFCVKYQMFYGEKSESLLEFIEWCTNSWKLEFEDKLAKTLEALTNWPLLTHLKQLHDLRIKSSATFVSAGDVVVILLVKLVARKLFLKEEICKIWKNQQISQIFFFSNNQKTNTLTKRVKFEKCHQALQ